MAWKNIISQADAQDLLGKPNVTFVDGSWYLPAQNRNGHQEYQERRIPGAVFFDIDAISDATSDLPHMMPSAEQFSADVGKLGISEDDQIIVYDGPGLFSAPRVWWSLKVMGAANVKILERGIDGWIASGLPLETTPPSSKTKAQFSASFDPSVIATKQFLVSNLQNNNATVLDARPLDRFIGQGQEPRPGLRSGHIPGAKSVPASSLVENGSLRQPSELEEIFASVEIKQSDELVTSCGSGVSALIISLALDELGYESVRLYDGSWSEWGKADGPEIATDQ